MFNVMRIAFLCWLLSYRFDSFFCIVLLGVFVIVVSVLFVAVVFVCACVV